MEQEIIETVLGEILEEIKIIRRENAVRERYAEELKNNVESFEEKLTSIKIKTQEINLLPLQLQLEASAQKIEKIINEQPKNLIHKKQILLFPETGAREYYGLVFGRLLFWMTIILIASYLFTLGKQFIDNWKEVKKYEIIQLQNELPDHSKDSHKHKGSN